ncbi:MAG TPA: alpha/beta hydrolase family protein [Chthonomonadaceae bacterium]|nr:alpha/beta hydrolase family protein [Chthonomonadaceae bacterium]
MAFAELKYFSKALEKATAADILLPESKLEGPFPVLYLLHGLSDDHTIWQRRTSIERYVQNLPLIVVMPDSGRGFYTDAEQGMAWETAIVRDLVDYVDTLFRTKATRAGRCVAGLSMGGYGAAKFALKYPDRFCAAVSHSGALGFAHRVLKPAPDQPRDTEFARITGMNPVGGPNDLYALAEKLPRQQRPALRIDCGTEDGLLDANRAFHAHLDKLGYKHEYQEFPGGHTWAYWDQHIQEALVFLTAQLKLKGV